MERRNLAPPLVVSIAGIVPLLPGLALLHGIYAILNDQHAVGFGSALGALVIGTALAAGVTLGEWSSWKVRRRRTRGLAAAAAARRRLGIRRSPRPSSAKCPVTKRPESESRLAPQPQVFQCGDSDVESSLRHNEMVAGIRSEGKDGHVRVGHCSADTGHEAHEIRFEFDVDRYQSV